MPRRPYKKRTSKSDPIHDSYEVAKLINYIMKDGKKAVARDIVYTTLENLQKVENDSLLTLNKAITNVTPEKEVRPRRLGGASYLVPVEVREDRKIYLALKWLINAAEARSNKEFKSFTNKLTAEIVEAAKNQGAAVEKRKQAEKVAEANKAFSHLRW